MHILAIGSSSNRFSPHCVELYFHTYTSLLHVGKRVHRKVWRFQFLLNIFRLCPMHRCSLSSQNLLVYYNLIYDDPWVSVRHQVIMLAMGQTLWIPMYFWASLEHDCFQNVFFSHFTQCVLDALLFLMDKPSNDSKVSRAS